MSSYFSSFSSNELCVRVCVSTSDGVKTFSQFLRTEFSEENIEFWLACEEFKTYDSEKNLLSKAKHIYTVFIESDAPKEVFHVNLLMEKDVFLFACHRVLLEAENIHDMGIKVWGGGIPNHYRVKKSTSLNAAEAQFGQASQQSTTNCKK